MSIPLLSIEPAPQKQGVRHPLLAHGFRPFFLLAALYGALFVPMWLAVFQGPLPIEAFHSPVIWHGHEMLFGLASAAMCGFLLTATATWSRIPPVTGTKLAMLVGTWIAGRAAIWLSGFLPTLVVAAVDLALFPVLAVAILPVLLSKGNRHNLIFLMILGMLFLANSLVHLEIWEGVEGTAHVGLRLGVNLFTFLIVVIIGRIVPTFLNVARLAEAPRQLVSRPWIDALAIGTMGLFLVADSFLAESVWAGGLALAASFAQALRMMAWRAGRLLRKPFLWALHLGYAWVTVGLGLIGWAYLDGPIPWVSGLHALTAGGIGMMVLTVMSIVGLLHTGRAAEIKLPIVAAYLLLSAGALLRVLAPVLLYESHREALFVSGILWAFSFALYLWVYVPILTRPRPDGIEG